MNNLSHATVPNRGGAIHNLSRGPLTITGSTFRYNRAVWGGAIYNHSDPNVNDPHNLDISNSFFAVNVSKEDGGAIYSKDSMTISNSFFHSNSAGNDGGAIRNANEFLTLVNNIFSNNEAQERGGAIFDVWLSKISIHPQHDLQQFRRCQRRCSRIGKSCAAK